MATERTHSIEMPSQSDHIDQLKASILAQQQTHRDTLHHNALDIVASLGGINKILTHYLTSDDIELEIDQLVKLQNIINSTTLIPSDPKSKIENDQQLTYTLNVQDTYYHHLFGTEIASKMLYYTYHKLSIIFLVLLTAGWFLAAIGGSYVYDVSRLVYVALTLIYCISCSLCINKTIFEKSMKHFIFWFKTIIAIEKAILGFILSYVMLNVKASLIVIGGRVLLQLCIIIAVINFSAIDGHQASKKVKIMMGVFISGLWTWNAIFFSALWDVEEQTMINVGTFQFSLLSLYASANRTLAIFLWKQTILIIVKGDKCINIRHSPKLKWIDGQ